MVICKNKGAFIYYFSFYSRYKEGIFTVRLRFFASNISEGASVSGSQPYFCPRGHCAFSASQRIRKTNLKKYKKFSNFSKD